MNATEATSNMVTALINNKFITTPNEVVQAYKDIYEIVRYPFDEKNKN